MRSILSPLDTAQKQPSREPYIPIVIHNRWEAVRRWDFTTLNPTPNPTAKHDVAVAADGSITRVRIESGNVKGQRVTAPLTPANWDSWTNYATGIGAQVACAAKGTRVAVVYTDAAGTGVYLIESTDSGASFGAATLIDTAASAVQDVAVTYKNTSGDMAVAWVLATTLRFRRRVGGAWGGAISHGTTQSNLNGIAMHYNGDWSMLVTGDAAGTTLGTVWTTAYGDGLDLTVGVFGSWLVQFQSDSSTAVTAYQAPFLTHDGTSFRASFVEIPFYTGGVARTYWTYLHPDLSWIIGSFGWRAPVPTDHHVTTGLALASDGAHVYASGTTIVRRASVAAVTLDVTNDVLALSLDEEQFDGGGWFDLDNTDGAYAGPPAPLQLGALVVLSMGYRTTSGLQSSRLQDLWVEGWEYRRTGGVGVLRVYVETGVAAPAAPAEPHRRLPRLRHLPRHHRRHPRPRRPRHQHRARLRPLLGHLAAFRH